MSEPVQASASAIRQPHLMARFDPPPEVQAAVTAALRACHAWKPVAVSSRPPTPGQQHPAVLRPLPTTVEAAICNTIDDWPRHADQDAYVMLGMGILVGLLAVAVLLLLRRLVQRLVQAFGRSAAGIWLRDSATASVGATLGPLLGSLSTALWRVGLRSVAAMQAMCADREPPPSLMNTEGPPRGGDLSRVSRGAARSFLCGLLGSWMPLAPLEKRYAHMRAACVPLESRWPVPPAAIVPLLRRLRGLGVLLIAEPVERARLARHFPRFGMTMSIPGEPTVIWVNYDAHLRGPAQVLDVAEIIDTIAHEAVHATGTMLGRYAVHPEGGNNDAYRAEEVCAMIGAAEIHRRFTLYEPWASLVAAGAKPFEFRSWAAPRSLWGRRVAIHASARKPRREEMQDLILRLRSDDAMETGLIPALALPLLERALLSPGRLPLSSVVCLATLGEPIRDGVLARKLGYAHVNDSDRIAHSKWGWPLHEIERLEPFVPARGAQGWWTWRRQAA